ncbi:MAG: hypothetical protein V3V70_00770 [Candidatus Scalindua sp.]
MVCSLIVALRFDMASQSQKKLAIKLKSIDWLIFGQVEIGDGKV